MNTNASGKRGWCKTDRALCCQITGSVLVLLIALWGFLFAALDGRENELRSVALDDLSTVAALVAGRAEDNLLVADLGLASLAHTWQGGDRVVFERVAGDYLRSAFGRHRRGLCVLSRAGGVLYSSDGATPSCSAVGAAVTSSANGGLTTFSHDEFSVISPIVSSLSMDGLWLSRPIKAAIPADAHWIILVVPSEGLRAALGITAMSQNIRVSLYGTGQKPLWQDKTPYSPNNSEDATSAQPLRASVSLAPYPAKVVVSRMLAGDEGSINLMARRHYTFGALTSLFLLLVGGWLFSLCKRQRVLGAQLDALRLEHLLDTGSNDTQRIRQEIHDDLGQKLMVIRMDIAMLARALAGGSVPQLSDALENLKNQVDGAIGSVRAIVDNRTPPELTAGLAPAIRQLVAVLKKSFPITILFNCYLTDDLVLDKDVEATAFRIIQESLANVVHHAKAMVIALDIELKNNNLVIRIADDGVGFPKEEKRVPLRSLRERVALAEGWIYTSNVQSGGACVEVSLPIKPCNHHLSTMHEVLT